MNRVRSEKMQAWYEEMIFVTEVIAQLYTYMAGRKRSNLEKAFQMLGQRYRLRYVPLGGKKNETQ